MNIFGGFRIASRSVSGAAFTGMFAFKVRTLPKNSEG